MSACILLARLWLGTLGTNLQVWLDRSKCGLGRDCQKDMVAWACHCLPSILCCVFPLATEGSWMHLLPWGPMDLVVSNPPYVFHRDMEELAPEILRCEAGWSRGPDLRSLGDGSALGATGRDGGGWSGQRCFKRLTPEQGHAQCSSALRLRPRGERRPRRGAVGLQGCGEGSLMTGTSEATRSRHVLDGCVP